MQDRTSFSAWQEKLDRSLHDVRLKGRERLTIMFIPHGHERIVSIHLNWYLVIFLSGLLLASAAFALTLFYSEQENSAERERLEAIYGANFRRSHETTTRIRELIQKLRTIQASILLAARMQGLEATETGLFLDKQALEETYQAQLNEALQPERRKSPGFRFIPAIESLLQAQGKAHSAQMVLNELPLIRIQPGLLTHVPFGRPVSLNAEMRDSSAYGLRMNPFGGAAFDFHTGYDMTSRHGTLIQATAAGRVKLASYSGSGYGNYVIIEHGREMFSLYAHLSRIFVQTGDEVRRGTELGTMGASGHATGVHLHYEIMIGEERRIDPLPFICALDRESATCKNYRT